MWGGIEKKNYRNPAGFAVDYGLSVVDRSFLLDSIAWLNVNDPEYLSSGY